MYLISLELKVPAGKNALVALGNIGSSDEPVNLHRINLSTTVPLTARLSLVAGPEIMGGDDVSLDAKTSEGGRAPLFMQILKLPEMRADAELSPIKAAIVQDEKAVLDDKDGVTLKRGVYLLLTVSAASEADIFLNLLWQRPRKDG